MASLAAPWTARRFEVAVRRLACGLARLSGRAARLRAEDELWRLPDRTLGELGLRRVDLLAGRAPEDRRGSAH